METNSTLWQSFKKHIDNSFIIAVLLLVALVALAVAVMFLDGVASYLQELLGRIGKYKVIQTIGFCIGGVLLVWQAWATNKRAKAMENTANSTATGQQEERLKNAIEHLGHKRASVCISGAYELFHLAKGTKGLRQTVLKILCAHIRHTTKGQTATDQTATGQTVKSQTATDQTTKGQTATDQTTKGQTATDQTATGQTATDQTARENDYQKNHKTKPSEEIQCMLTLFFAQKHDLDVFENCPINLQGSYLNGADLRQAQLQGADLRDAQLQRAKLQGANLKEAQLQGADLSEAQLQGAHLYKAQLQGAHLSNADSAPDSDKGKGD